MNLENITVTEISGVITVYSERGKLDKMTDRKHYGLSLCSEGRITYIQDGKKYVCDKDNAVILPKGGTYFIQRDETGLFPVINFDCLDFLCDSVTVIPVQNATQLLADYERIKKLFLFDGNRTRIFGIFYEMISKLTSDDIPCELKPAMRLIKNGFCDASLTNARLSAECNISEVYFRRLFVKYFGTSPKQFIIDMRNQKAKQLLAEGLLSISAISESCGFSNPYHFCRLFKQHTGATPSEYRKSNLIYEI